MHKIIAFASHDDFTSFELPLTINQKFAWPEINLEIKEMKGNSVQAFQDMN